MGKLAFSFDFGAKQLYFTKLGFYWVKLSKTNSASVGRHAKSHNHGIIDCGNIFRLRKDRGWNTVKFVENIIFNSINDNFWMMTAEILHLMFQKGLNQLDIF